VPKTDNTSNVVSAGVTAPKVPEGIVEIRSIATTGPVDGCQVFTHYNGPTDQLSGLCVGMAGAIGQTNSAAGFRSSSARQCFAEMSTAR
jgi:hypothetical protein